MSKKIPTSGNAQFSRSNSDYDPARFFVSSKGRGERKDGKQKKTDAKKGGDFYNASQDWK